jgi:uncharacterized protein DUF2877
MTDNALSVSPYAAALLAGPPRVGRVGGHGFVLVGDDVLALTAPGALRMPNGIETRVQLPLGAHVVVGGGTLRCGGLTLDGGPTWEPRPRVVFGVAVTPVLDLDVDSLIGWGPGLTPLGDDVAIGYHAAAALAGRPLPIAANASTTALGRVLLRLSEEGSLPEAAHALLERGDPQPLLAFGHTSGGGLMLGLALGGAGIRSSRQTLSLCLPLGTFTVTVGESTC